MMMFFVSTCKVATSAQEEQPTNQSTNSNNRTFEQQIDYAENSTYYTQANKHEHHVSVRDVRSDVGGFPGTTPFGA